MNQVIRIGRTEIPLADYAIGAAAILGVRDSGKTVTAKGIAEQLLEHNIPIIVFDAVGKWRWMKVPGPKSADLKVDGKGFPIVVAGGRDPDLPLTPHSVAEIVRSAVKERIPLVIDLYDASMSKEDWRRIVKTAIRIIHYENMGGPLHVFLEEAAEYIPQKVIDGQTYAEVEKIARMGGNQSVGLTLINQRSQEVNKAVLDLCTTLVLGCQVGNKAIEAVEKWVDRLDPDTADAVTHSLPKLHSGEAWVWTRQSPDAPAREKIPMCRSFHPDRRTPEHMVNAIPRVDAKQFVARMAKAIPKVLEDAKANDPAELRKEITKLKGELAKKPLPAKVETKEVSIIPRAAADDLGKIQKLMAKMAGDFDGLSLQVSRFITDVSKTVIQQNTAIKQAGIAQPLISPKPHKPSLVIDHFQTTNSDGLPSGQESILIAVAQNPNATRQQLTILTGFKRSTRDKYLQLLQGRGYVAVSGDRISATDAGIAALGDDYQPLPTGEALKEYWLAKLPEGHAKVLEAVIDCHPNVCSRERISEVTTFKRSTRDKYLQYLQACYLVEDVGAGLVKASDTLFG